MMMIFTMMILKMMISDEKPHRSIFGNKKSRSDDFDDFDMDEDKHLAPSSGNKVTPMRQPAARRGVNMEVCVVKPTSVDDSREITETLLAGRTVILNLEGMDLEIAQRIIDFISGATLRSAEICRRFLITSSL